MTANAHRGEASLTLGKNTYRLRPTFEALVQAEAELGSLLALVERAGSGALSVTDIAVLLHHCACAGGHDVTREDFAAALLQEGLAASAVPLRTLLSGIMGGDGKHD